MSESRTKKMGCRERTKARFRAFAARHGLWEKGDGILVGVSGGADSTALLDLLRSAQDAFGLRLTVAHLDHGLRGAAARREARLVREQARKLGMEFVGGRAGVRERARREKLSLETAARTVRYDFFRENARRRKIRLVAVGHQADDQAETVLMRLLRGSGPGGLAGMRPRQQMGDIVLIRPLLCFTRGELLEYLRERKLDFTTDASNRDRRYFRNRIRLELLPFLEKEYSPAIRRILLRLAELEGKREDYLASRARDAWRRMAGQGRGKATIKIAAWLKLHPALRGEVMKLFIAGAGGPALSAGHHETIERLAHSTSGRSVRLPGGLKLTREFGLLRAGEQAASGYRYRLPCPGKVRVPEAGVEVTARLRKRERAKRKAWTGRRRAAGKLDWPPERKLSELMDYSRLLPPLEVRSRRPGDGYRPLGLSGEKKLKKLFIDLKIPLSRRNILPVIADAKRIIWPAGAPPADFCRVTETTEKLLEISVTRIA